MSQRPIPGDGASSELEGGLLIADSTPVPDLPGLFKKSVVLGPEETGFLTSNGSVLRELSSGPNKVGWSILSLHQKQQSFGAALLIRPLCESRKVGCGVLG